MKTEESIKVKIDLLRESNDRLLEKPLKEISQDDLNLSAIATGSIRALEWVLD